MRLVLLPMVAYVFTSLSAFAQGADVRIMQRVDTTHPHVRQVLRLWSDSLSEWSTPQQWYGQHLYRPTTQSVVRDWFYHEQALPTVLSIDFDGSGYAVRTLFTLPTRSGINEMPLGLLRCRFVSSDTPGQWIIENTLDGAIRHWDTTVIAPITFIHAPVFIIDTADTQVAVSQLVAAKDRFALQLPEDITCVVVSSRDELCQLLGIEYYAFPPSALSFPRSLLMLKSFDASLSHELMHLLFADYAQAHPVLREGVATLLGGTGVEDLQQTLQLYMSDRSTSTTPSFVQLFSDPHVEQADIYVLGAVLCKEILRVGGRSALFEVMLMTRTSDVMYRIASLLDLDIADQQTSMYPFLIRFAED